MQANKEQIAQADVQFQSAKIIIKTSILDAKQNCRRSLTCRNGDVEELPAAGLGVCVGPHAVHWLYFHLPVFRVSILVVVISPLHQRVTHLDSCLFRLRHRRNGVSVSPTTVYTRLSPLSHREENQSSIGNSSVFDTAGVRNSKYFVSLCCSDFRNFLLVRLMRGTRCQRNWANDRVCSQCISWGVFAA